MHEYVTQAVGRGHPLQVKPEAGGRFCMMLIAMTAAVLIGGRSDSQPSTEHGDGSTSLGNGVRQGGRDSEKTLYADFQGSTAP